MIVEFRGGRFDLGPAELADLRRQLEEGGLPDDTPPAPTPFDELPEILTMKQVLKHRVVPLGKSTLQRIAVKGGEDSPWYKRSGVWMTTKTDLIEWVHRGSHGRSGDPVDPMPPTHTRDGVLAALNAREGS